MESFGYIAKEFSSANRVETNSRIRIPQLPLLTHLHHRLTGQDRRLFSWRLRGTGVQTTQHVGFHW